MGLRGLELLAERGIAVDHATLWRWVERYDFSVCYYDFLIAKEKRCCYKLSLSGRC